MDPWDIAGHIAYALLAAGAWMIGNKDKRGFILYFVANIAWLVIGWKIGMSSIWMWEIVFLILAWRNFRRWKADEADEPS